MCSLELCGCGLYLSVLSIYDIATQKIPRWLLQLGICGTIILKYFYRNTSILLASMGVGIGIAFCIISKITEEMLGMGDSYLITILGWYVGGWNLLYILAYAFLFSACYSAILLSIKKFKKNIQIPFVPFLLIAYILWSF